MKTDSPIKENQSSNIINQIFKSDIIGDNELRVIGTYENPLFVARDIATILGYTDTKQAIRKNIDDEDKLSFGQLQKSGGVCQTPLKIQDETILINESGLYSLILRSKLEKAREFKRWIESDVLPSIKNNMKVLALKEVKEYKLKLKDNSEFLLPIRGDGMVNATLLCKAGGKTYSNWIRNESVNELVNELESVLQIRRTELITTIKGGNSKLQGTWIHPDLAIQLAQWISPKFAIQVSRWIRELLITGKVELGNELSTKELEDKYQEKIKNLEKENTRLLKLHNQMTQKHQYYKFKTKGPVFYIIISGLEYKDNIIRVKIGIAGCSSNKIKNCPNCDYCIQNKDESESLDSRLANHRTLWPQLQVKFAVFTPDASLLEKCIKRQFKDRINPHGHELVYNVEPQKIIMETMKYLNMFNVYNEEKEYLISNDIEEYNVNAVSHMKSIDSEIIVEDIQSEDDKNDSDYEDETENCYDIEQIKIYSSMTKVELSKKFTTKQLQVILKQFNLISSGLKDVQLTRLITFCKEQLENLKINKRKATTDISPVPSKKPWK
jgi:prophage antirepressor-like protein